MTEENNGYKELYGSLDNLLDFNEFRRAFSDVSNKAFDRILSDTFEGKLKWRRDLKDHYTFRTQAQVTNAIGDEVTIQALYLAMNGEGEPTGHLHLIDQNGPVIRGYADERVKRLGKEYLKIDEIFKRY